MQIKVDITVSEGAKAPQYATAGSSGMDLCSSAKMLLNPGEYALVPTGLSIALPKGYEAQVRPRSGLAANYGIGMLNSPGTIDSDYRGEVKVLLMNYSKYEFEILPGDRIAQLVVAAHATVSWNIVDNINKTERGDGGFGSTGRH